MTVSSKSEWRRVRLERGIYVEPNGAYSVCVMIDGKPRFRVVAASTIEEARRQRVQLQTAAHLQLLPASPRLTLAEAATRWLADFEAKVASGERRERTLAHYRHALDHHLLPRLGHRQLRLIRTDELAEPSPTCRGRARGLE